MPTNAVPPAILHSSSNLRSLHLTLSTDRHLSVSPICFNSNLMEHVRFRNSKSFNSVFSVYADTCNVFDASLDRVSHLHTVRLYLVYVGSGYSRHDSGVQRSDNLAYLQDFRDASAYKWSTHQLPNQIIHVCLPSRRSMTGQSGSGFKKYLSSAWVMWKMPCRR